VAGRHIDIYVNSLAEARRFGKKTVTVVVLRYGDNQLKK
jgi:3D (Asp-Asp-Asp) domain-containing protein